MSPLMGWVYTQSDPWFRGECSDVFRVHLTLFVNNINPLRAKFLARNIKMYLWCIPFLHIDMTKVLEILITMTSQWARLRLKSPATRLFTQPGYSDADQRKHQSSASLAFCARNSPEAGEFPAQKASNAENVSIWWRHHVLHVRQGPTYFTYSISWPLMTWRRKEPGH